MCKGCSYYVLPLHPIGGVDTMDVMKNIIIGGVNTVDGTKISINLIIIKKKLIHF
jgi:hypothetical protein